METNSTPELLQKLKCFQCNKYLSYFPIYSDVNQNSVCGRCQPVENFFHNDIYEISMENVKFPCSYASNGCVEELVPKEIRNHEDWCEFRKIQCPVISSTTEADCNWQGFAADIYEHFEQNHPKFILQDGKFEADLISNYKGKFLYAFGQDYFIVTKSTDSVKNMVTCNVTYIGGDPNVKNYSFKITLKNANGAKKVDVVGKIGDTVNIDGLTVIDLLGDPLSILAEIDVYEETKNNNEANAKRNNSAVNYEMIEGMKCLQCWMYMLPPIYQCEAGHCVCSDCIQEIKKCPKCKGGFNSTQNFALAQVIQHMIYPCVHPNCNFSCKSKDIRKHEAFCPYRPTLCPVEESTFCDAKPIASKIYEHLFQDHSDIVLLTDQVSCILDEDEAEILDYVIPYHKKVFVLHFVKECSGDSDEMIIWNMQLISSDVENKRYKFGIDIQDYSGKIRRIYMIGDCTLCNLSSKPEVFLTYEQIKPYLCDNQLSYRVTIIEEES